MRPDRADRIGGGVGNLAGLPPSANAYYENRHSYLVYCVTSDPTYLVSINARWPWLLRILLATRAWPLNSWPLLRLFGTQCGVLVE
jgi:hypothetical protein